MKCYMKGQEKGGLLIEVTAGLTVYGWWDFCLLDKMELL